jgi:hypothetical protein
MTELRDSEPSRAQLPWRPAAAVNPPGPGRAGYRALGPGPSGPPAGNPVTCPGQPGGRRPSDVRSRPSPSLGSVGRVGGCRGDSDHRDQGSLSLLHQYSAGVRRGPPAAGRRPASAQQHGMPIGRPGGCTVTVTVTVTVA